LRCCSTVVLWMIRSSMKVTAQLSIVVGLKVPYSAA
jgi:hypothetical protein